MHLGVPREEVGKQCSRSEAKQNPALRPAASAAQEMLMGECRWRFEHQKENFHKPRQALTKSLCGKSSNCFFCHRFDYTRSDGCLGPKIDDIESSVHVGMIDISSIRVILLDGDRFPHLPFCVCFTDSLWHQFLDQLAALNGVQLVFLWWCEELGVAFGCDLDRAKKGRLMKVFALKVWQVLNGGESFLLT